MKAKVRERDGFKCVKCGMSNDEHIKWCGRQLDVHRKTPGSFYTLEGCETLCKKCHPRGLRPGGADLAHSQIMLRLSQEVLERLDELASLFSEENSDQESRTSVLRKLINREWEQRRKQKKQSG